MKIENVTSEHRVGGRMVLMKKSTARRDRETGTMVPGYLLRLEGGAESFVEEGGDVEITSGGSTQTRTRGRIRSRR